MCNRGEKNPPDKLNAVFLENRQGNKGQIGGEEWGVIEAESRRKIIEGIIPRSIGVKAAKLHSIHLTLLDEPFDHIVLVRSSSFLKPDFPVATRFPHLFVNGIGFVDHISLYFCLGLEGITGGLCSSNICFTLDKEGQIIQLNEMKRGWSSQACLGELQEPPIYYAWDSPEAWRMDAAVGRADKNLCLITKSTTFVSLPPRHPLMKEIQISAYASRSK